MSGRGRTTGRSGRGFHRGGRTTCSDCTSNGGRNNYYGSRSHSENDDEVKMKFGQQQQGKVTATFDVVKDHIINEIQSTFKHGGTIAKAPGDGQDVPNCGAVPVDGQAIDSQETIRLTQMGHQH